MQGRCLQGSQAGQRANLAPGSRVTAAARPPAAGHSQRRCRCFAAAAAAPAGANPSAGPPSEIVRISPELLQAGGLDPSREAPGNLALFEQMLSKGFLQVNLQQPGLRVVNIDPPVFTVEQFVPGDVCDALREAAAGSGRMRQSGVGGVGDLKEDIRTSSTLAITKDVLADVPAIREPLRAVLQAAGGLLGEGLDKSALDTLQFVRPEGPRQLAPELPQVAHYLPGQHFLSHEDGFPAAVALEKGYQRRATLLVYLNDVPSGGATTFDHLGISVRPAKGKALLFFPAFSGGRSDARTLHTAEDAVEGCEKWLFQSWFCTVLPQRPRVDVAEHAMQQLAAARKGGGAAAGGGKGGKKGGKKRR